MSAEAGLERVVREEWGRLTSLLLAQFRRLDLVEDAGGQGRHVGDAEHRVAGAGAVVAPDASYRITVNSFLAGGGDGFTVLPAGTNQVTGQIDLDAFTAYLQANSPVSAPALDRITTIG